MAHNLSDILSMAKKRNDQARDLRGIQSLQVINLSPPRHGTSSFALAMEMLGITPVLHGFNLYTRDWRVIWPWYKVLKSRDNDDLLAAVDGYAAICDGLPQAFLYELIELFPHAKFVLSERKFEEWQTSVAKTLGLYGSWLHLFAIYPWYPSMWGIRILGPLARAKTGQRLGGALSKKENYQKNRQQIIAAIPESQLLLWNPSDGWEPLCKFLGKSVPQVPYPRTNETAELRQMIASMHRDGLRKWTATIVLAAGILLYRWNRR